MAVYLLKPWIRGLGILFFIIGGGLVMWPVIQGQETLFYAFITRGIGMFIAGAVILSTKLRVGSDRYSSHIIGISRGVRFSDITSLELKRHLGTKSGTSLNLIVRFERDGKKAKRIINKISQFENYEQFIREVEMFSGKKVEK